MQLELFPNVSLNPPITSAKNPPILSCTSTVQDTTRKLLETHNYNFQQGDYKSYRISVENGIISKVYFSIWKYKFLVYLDTYSFISKDVPVNHYYEANIAERDTIISTKTLTNFKMKGIQKKDPAWYGPFKEYIDYFSFTGLKYVSLKLFLESLVKQYHKN